MPTLHEPLERADSASSAPALHPDSAAHEDAEARVVRIQSSRSSAVAAALPRIEQIDVLRGLAAVWVMFSHYQPYWSRHFEPTTIIVPNSVGMQAVELFFVISGFVIFMTLERCRTVLDFAVLRGSRLYPAYWVALALNTFVGVVLLGGTFWPGGLLTNISMFEEFLGFPRFDVVFWSLTVELAFYLNVAWLFALGLHRHPKPIVAAWLTATCIWALLVADPTPTGGAFGADHRGWVALLFALDYAPYFAMGILFFDGTKLGWSWKSTALFAFAVFAELLLAGWVEMATALFIASVFWLALNGHLRFIVSGVTLGLGAISYSLYVIHRNLGYIALDWLHAHNVHASAAMPVVIGGMIALAAMITYGVERPAIAAIRLRYRRQR